MPDFKAYPLPSNTAPTGKRCLQVTIPDDDDYETLLLAAVNVLSYWFNYDRDDAHSGALVADIFKKVMASWTDCAGNPLPNLGDIVEDAMPLHVDCDCKVTVDCCDGTTKQLVTTDMINQPPQPGAGSPQPGAGGGVHCYDMVLSASGKWFIPTPLNTGDVVKGGLSAGAMMTGSSNDGTDARLYCGNGSEYFGGSCNTSGAHTVSTDPLNTQSHMGTLIVIAGVYYVLGDGTFTVPSGVVNQNAYIQLNTGNLSICSGSIASKICVTNNQVPTWSEHWHFPANDGGWVLDPAVGACPGQYIPGVGWHSLDGDCIGANATYLTFLKYFAATITSIRVVYDVSGTTPSGDMDDGSIALGILDTTAGHHDLTFTGTHVITNYVRFALTSSPAGGVWNCTDIYMTGTGTNPF